VVIRWRCVSLLMVVFLLMMRMMRSGLQIRLFRPLGAQRNVIGVDPVPHGLLGAFPLLVVVGTHAAAVLRAVRVAQGRVAGHAVDVVAFDIYLSILQYREEKICQPYRTG
jgi:hypothetical protein